MMSNFAQLQQHDEQLLRIGMLAERYFTEDPNTSLLKLRQLAEGIAQTTATYVGIYKSPQEGVARRGGALETATKTTDGGSVGAEEPVASILTSGKIRAHFLDRSFWPDNPFGALSFLRLRGRAVIAAVPFFCRCG